MNRNPQSGFSLVEVLVGMVVGSIVLAGAYKLWHTHETEGYRLGKKIDLRNEMTLASKRIQRSITLAGIGLKGAANLAKEDAVGSDTLIVYKNLGEKLTVPTSDISHSGGPVMYVEDASIFAVANYVVVSSGSTGEIRRIVSQSGSTLNLDSPFTFDHPAATSMTYPATRERYYTDQEGKKLMWESGATPSVVAKDLKNFQVSFRNKHGDATEIAAEVRTVQFSFTGIFPAREGALNSIVFSSIAIPRNTL
jgi:prepilin-type N-terminal cleavage/methylation domain-containing protein